MSFTLAVIADTHLPAVAGTAQETCLDWALATLAAAPPDLLAVAGDLTAAGSLAAATAWRETLARYGLPTLLTPGNSDRRDPVSQASVLRVLATPSIFDHPACRVSVLDTSTGAVSVAAHSALCAAGEGLGERALVVVTHLPPEYLEPESRARFEAWVRRARPALIVAAHSHRDREYCWAGAPVHTVRGLDPDKAIGGPPAVALFTLHEGEWQRRELGCPAGEVAGWSAAARGECGALLGLACSGEAVAGLRRATAERVACVELRACQAQANREALAVALKKWRQSGGRYLSWHMPEVPWREGAVPDGELAQWRELLQWGLDCGVQALTVHAPCVPVGSLQPEAKAWRDLATLYCHLLEPAVARGVRIGIENMHMRPGEAVDETRRYGYLPDECLTWIDQLRAHLGTEAVGMLLDLGHARNNAPFAGEFTLGAWYALVGRQTVGYHLHQVVSVNNELRNHQPLTSLYGPLIALGSFFWAWHTGQLNHAPIFIEVTDPEGQRASLHTLRRGLGL